MIIFKIPKLQRSWSPDHIRSFSTAITSTRLPIVERPQTNESRRFAIFAASIHSNKRSYIFYSPITAAAWQRIGYQVIFVFAGDFTENSNAFQLNLTRTMLGKLGVNVIDFQCDMSYSIKISQLVRMFAGFLPDSIADDRDYILTTDSDIIPILEKDYQLTKNTMGFIYNAFCCGFFKRREKSYPMYPMSHICLSKLTWRNLLLESIQRNELLNSSVNSSYLLSDKAPFSFDTISIYTRHEFRNLYDANMTKGDASWYMDQVYSSMLLNDYLAKHPNFTIDKRHKNSPRLDPNLQKYFWEPQTLKRFGDAHVVHDEIFDSNYWAALKSLLYILCKASLVEQFDSYYKQFVDTIRDKPQQI